MENMNGFQAEISGLANKKKEILLRIPVSPSDVSDLEDSTWDLAAKVSGLTRTDPTTARTFLELQKDINFEFYKEILKVFEDDPEVCPICDQDIHGGDGDVVDSTSSSHISHEECMRELLYAEDTL